MLWAACAVAGLALLAVALGVWAFAVEPRWFRVRRVILPRVASRDEGAIAVPAARLPTLEILHVSDTHFGSADAGKVQFLRRVSSKPFDLVLLTGDLLDTPAGLAPCLASAEFLRGRLGCFAVLGGHDYFYAKGRRCRWLSLRRPKRPPPPERRIPNPVEALVQGLKERGVEVLKNESRIIPCGDEQLAVVGLEDAFVARPDYDAAWRHVPEGMPTIVLAHSPDVLPETVRRGTDLAFFGHTHGGQVRFPFVGAVVTRSHLDAARASGVFREGGTVFTLNNGVGAGEGIDLRLLCRPEVTVMELR